MPDPLAAVHDGIDAALERRGLRARRRDLLASATGHVVELGAATGGNLGLYDAGRVRMVVALEPHPALRRRLIARVAAAPVTVEVHESGIDDCGLPDAYADTVVSTLALCREPDLVRALAAVRRLLRPEGRLLFLEHVRTPGPLGSVQRAASPAWSLLRHGCRLDRDVPAGARQAGLLVTECERFTLRPPNPFLRAAVVGSARPRLSGAEGEQREELR
jgi:SAM-dependent methyltransferase